MVEQLLSMCEAPDLIPDTKKGGKWGGGGEEGRKNGNRKIKKQNEYIFNSCPSVLGTDQEANMW